MGDFIFWGVDPVPELGSTQGMIDEDQPGQIKSCDRATE